MRSGILSCGAIALLGSSLSAQDTTRSNAAVVIRASVSASEVRFAKQPTLSVKLYYGAVDSIRVLERRNLPNPVQPGVTYRDVYVSVEILGHLNAECLSAQLTRALERRVPGDTLTCASRPSPR